MKAGDIIALGWMAILSLATFLVFGFDKWRAGSGQRVSEFKLVLMAALGGWLGMKLFHHKTAKPSFKFQFALALIPFAAGIWVWWHWR